jgi:hypothetical protein
MSWSLPGDLDQEILGLCQAMNEVPGIQTVESCCGHGDRPVRVWFTARSLEDLPALLYWFSSCHSGQYGWQVIARTDCSQSPVVFTAEGPPGGYLAADAIARAMREAG